MDKPGIILKISVKNFVTYTDAEMYPGPHLNMIIGPNGTGKSTMVAAIILGLGGSPKTVGRGTKVSEYVKHHCQDARIDIVLRASDGSNTVTVMREFDLNDKSVWRINGNEVSLKKMLDQIKMFNIQVDNLCQFLPQDRVQDFAKMNRQELLKQTVRALCRDDLIEKQQNLIERRRKHKVVLATFDNRKKKLQEAKDANLRLEGKVKNFNQKKKLLADIKNINRKISWVRYEEIAERRNEIKADRNRAAELLENHKQAAAPIEAAIKNARSVISKLRENVMQMENKMKTVNGEIQRYHDQYGRHKESIQEVKAEMSAKIAEIAQRQNDIKTAQMKLAKLMADKEDLLKICGPDSDMEAKIEQHNNEIRQISKQIGVIEAKKSEVSTSKSNKTYEIRALENELRKIENVKQQRLEYLRRRDSDAYKATLWLRENGENFRGQVFEPMLLELNVINSKNAIYLENTIAMRDRLAITCTNKEDMNMLIRVFRDEQKLAVNIVYSDAKETVQMYQPHIPIERLKKFGFHAYLSSLVAGPAPVITYLCKNYRIHNTPVGSAITNDCYEEVPQEVPTFFSDKFKFSCSYSKYTGNKIVRQNEIITDGSLSISLDLSKLENIRGQLNDNYRHCEKFDEETRNLQTCVSQLAGQKERLTESLKKLRGVSQNILTIDSQIRVTNTNIEQLEGQTVTEDDIKREGDDKIRDTIKQMIHLQKLTSEKFTSSSTFHNDIELKQLKLKVSEKHVAFLENKAIVVRELCQEAENTLENIKRSFNDVTKEARQILEKAKELSNGFTPQDEGFNVFREDYDTLGDDLVELEREKSEIYGRMECLNSADEAEMKEYEDRVELIENLEDSLRNDNVEIESTGRKMGKMESEYLSALQELVDRISGGFSGSFERMGCAGDVSIYKGDDPQDYEHYGLSVKVTYRNGEPLQELNGITQSGGERAVATATYMLSLQQLTPVPFRCVDEINQGMDEINERRIFDLLFECTGQPNTSQYFLITPKLIPNLNYVDTMKLHIVHNGPFVPPHEEWNRSTLHK